MFLSMTGITKSYDKNQVLTGVDLRLERGEIRALIGENGAGKSTLMNILGGVTAPDAGDIRLSDRVLHLQKPGDAIDQGIAFIHQELNLVGDLSVAENLYIGRELKKGLLLDKRAMRAETARVLERMRVAVSPDAMVRDLDASYKQIIEIARALLMKASLIIMDEPTTSLTEVEIGRVFQMMRTLKEQGVSIIFISHKLKEVLSICDTVTVLRDGRVVHEGDVRDADELSLSRWMVGHDVRTEQLHRDEHIGDEVLRVERLSLFRAQTGGLFGKRVRQEQAAFENITFSLRAGEILGVTGLLGDGRSELFQTVFGCHPAYTGEVWLYGKRTRLRDTAAAYRAGLGYVPRDRKENGIIKDMSILQNGTIVIIRELAKPLIRHKDERALMRDQIGELSIKVFDMDEAIGSLSGGNQQKVVLAKWLAAKPKIIIFDNPTQGVDVGAKEEIYDIILRLAERGVAIAVLSSEAQEIIRLCDRTLVLFHGHVQGELARGEMNEHNIMALATGASLAPGESEEGKPL